MQKIEMASPTLNDKPASEVFQACPRCKDPDLIQFDGEVICASCGWDSIEISVESQISAHCARYKKARETASVSKSPSTRSQVVRLVSSDAPLRQPPCQPSESKPIESHQNISTNTSGSQPDVA